MIFREFTVRIYHFLLKGGGDNYLILCYLHEFNFFSQFRIFTAQLINLLITFDIVKERVL